MDATLKGFLVAVVLALIGYGLSRLGRSRDRKSEETLRKEVAAIEAVKERDKRIDELERHVEKLQTMADERAKAAIPIALAMEQVFIARLTNGHTPEADALLKKHTDNTLTAADAIQFAKLLKERETDKDPRIGRLQQIAAEMLPLIIEQRKLEEESADETTTTTVTVTVPVTETVDAADGGTQKEEKGN